MKRRLQLVSVDGEQGAHVEARVLGVRFFHERLAGEDVHRAVRQLVFDDLRICRLVDDVIHHVACVIEAGLQRGDLRARLGLHDAADVHVFARVRQVAHIVGVVAFVLPHVVVGVVLVVVGGGDQLERHVHELVVRERHVVVGRGDLFLVCERAHHVVELAVVAQPHGVEHEVAHLAIRGEHQHDIVVVLRPCARHDIVLVLVKIGVARHFVEDVGGHHRGHDAVGGSGRSEADGRKRFVGIDLPCAIFGVGAEQLRGDIVAVFDGIHVLVDSRIAVVQVLFQACEVVAADAAEHAGHHFRLADGAACRIAARAAFGFPAAVRAFVAWGTRGTTLPAHAHGHEACHVESLVLDGERVLGERFLLDIGDVAVHAVRERENRSDADDADRAREGGHEGAALLREQVVPGKGQRCEETHRCAANLLLARADVFGRGVEGVGVAADDAVRQVDDARCVLFGKLGVVRDHDDEPIVRDFGQEVHNLHARFGIERTGGLVGQENLRVVDECSGDCDALHLPA